MFLLQNDSIQKMIIIVPKYFKFFLGLTIFMISN